MEISFLTLEEIEMCLNKNNFYVLVDGLAPLLKFPFFVNRVLPIIPMSEKIKRKSKGNTADQTLIYSNANGILCIVNF